MITASVRLRGFHGPRKPQLYLALGKEESARHHADHRERFAVEIDAAIDDAWVAIEPSLPKRVAQHDDVFAADLIFIRCERAANCRLHAEQIENVRGDELSFETLRLA